MTKSTKARKPQRMCFETLFHHNFILVPRAYDLLVSGWINFKICGALETNLVPRVLRHFGQWLVTRRDSGELAILLPICNWLYAWSLIYIIPTDRSLKSLVFYLFNRSLRATPTGTLSLHIL